MIKIIAVHPDVMSTPEGIREYLKDFGTSRGRWIPLLPGKWKSIVSQAIKQHPGLGPVKRNELRDKITNLKYGDRYLKIENVPDGFSDYAAWNQPVGDLCENGAFDAAITPVPGDTCELFLTAFEFDPDSELYASKLSTFVPRNPEALVEKIVPALRFAKEIHVIDAYCLSQGNLTRAYGKFFQGLLAWCRRNNPSLREITLHRRCPEDLETHREKANYESWLLPILKPGETIRVRYLRERDHGEKLHLRAIFTDRVMLSSHYGFGGGSSEQETTDLNVRENEDLIQLRNLYLSDENRGFDLIGTLEIAR